MAVSARNHLAPLLLLALVALGVSVHVALLAPPLWDNDERAHAGYALEVMHGRLPTIDTPVPNDRAKHPQIAASLHVQRDQAHRDIWTANHPPLYYVLSAPLLAAADALHHPGAGLLAMRVLDALGMAAGIVLVGLLARELVPDRPAVPVLAAIFAVSCVTVLHLGGLILNDGLAAAASSAALLCAVRMLRHGPTGRQLVATALLGAAAAGLRAPGVLAVLIATVTVLLAGLRHGRSVPRSIGAALLVGGVPALAAGWFYVRNIYLYGDPGATAALLTKFHRQSRGSLLQVAFSPDLYVFQFRELWVREGLGWPRLALGPAVILAAAALGLVVAVVRARGVRPADRAPWLLLGGYAILVQGTVISFYRSGGTGHVRYLIPSLPLIGTLAAVGLLGLVARHREWLGTAVFGVLLLGFAGVVQARSSRQILDSNRIPGLKSSTVDGVAPWISLGLAALAALALLALLVRRSTVPPAAVTGARHRAH